ncbi:MAG: hypothetical protein NZ926_02585 [Candidatus Methanomethylicia archaeon]|nr:hypothetical protein [Candidatus Methanomethylicia archaeon]MCX8169199.1 hypothetical protein [Candidatus Methanomethylicia archaeon]MDW7989019.1 hypothetical protein [Nitrososphaerota archaeon]
MYYNLSILEKFKLKFKDKGRSWVNRCIARLNDVTKTSDPNVWFVKGKSKFGDYYEIYKVTFIKSAGKYVCTCYSISKMYGLIRMRNICTHVGSVILWRMLKGDLIEESKT